LQGDVIATARAYSHVGKPWLAVGVVRFAKPYYDTSYLAKVIYAAIVTGPSAANVTYYRSAKPPWTGPR